MTALVAFLRARLDYDEAFAIGWRNGGREYAGTAFPVDPSRMLAEIEAKRRVINECIPIVEMDGWEYTDAPNLAEAVLRALAQPYADHPDFDPTWRL